MSRFAPASLWEHPWLVGDPTLPGRTIGRRVRWLTVGVAVTANVIGAAVVICFALFALPKPEEALTLRTSVLNLSLALAYLLVAAVLGIVWGRRAIERGPCGTRAWLDGGDPPDAAQQRHLLRAPLRIMRVQASLWVGAVIAFTALNLTISGLLALGVGLTVALGGLTTSAATYLLSELSLRPLTARALAPGVPRQRALRGVATRLMLAWALGTGVPLLGLMLVGIVALTHVDISRTALAVTAVTLSGIGLLAGMLVTVLAAYATAHPIGALRRALERVRTGDFDTELPVWDTTEIGMLQAGFNEMSQGLRERERIRDLFGRQVGEDVARQALDGGVRLGGELREVAVLFVDIVGSTGLAERRPPQEVVELLNRFFAEVVDVIEERGGWINKFQGDAALAIFGAPVEVDDAAGCCLAAARDLDAHLREHVPELQAGIGVAAGRAVAGHIGAERRFEYTVIGDPVNEAARLTELAKRQDPRVLASEAAVAAAGEEEAARWELGDEVTLRGRLQPTRRAHPRATMG